VDPDNLGSDKVPELLGQFIHHGNPMAAQGRQNLYRLVVDPKVELRPHAMRYGLSSGYYGLKLSHEH
jgi:hypothetical protein